MSHSYQYYRIKLHIIGSLGNKSGYIELGQGLAKKKWKFGESRLFSFSTEQYLFSLK